MHGATVLRVCRAVLGPADADDAWSETFLSAMRAYPDLPADANVEAWLVTIAHRKAIDVTRAAGRRAIPTDSAARHTRRRGRPADRDGDLADAADATATQAAPGRRLPLPGRAAVRRGRRHPRRQHRRRPPRRRRRHRHPPAHLPGAVRPHEEGEHPMNDNVNDDLHPRPGAGLTDTPRRAAPACTHRLAAAAERDGILDVAYRTVDTPVGPLLLAATEHGLVRVAYASEDHDTVLQALADRISPRILHAPARLDAAAGELDEYFAGARHDFDLPLDWRLSAGFRAQRAAPPARHRLRAHRQLRRGRRAAGNPKAVRAVGTACATNPLPVVVPCHRVVRSTARWAATSAAPRPNGPCSPWRPQHEPRTADTATRTASPAAAHRGATGSRPSTGTASAPSWTPTAAR